MRRDAPALVAGENAQAQAREASDAAVAERDHLEGYTM